MTRVADHTPCTSAAPCPCPWRRTGTAAQHRQPTLASGLFKYLVVGVEDDDGDLTVAQNTQLVGFLHQTKFPLGEGHLSVPLVGYPRNVDLLPAHVGQSPCI